MKEILPQVSQVWRVYETEEGPVRLQRFVPHAGSTIQNAVQAGLRRGYRFCRPTVGRYLQDDRSTMSGFLIMPTSQETADIFVVLPGGSQIAPVKRSLESVEKSPLGWLLVMADPA